VIGMLFPFLFIYATEDEEDYEDNNGGSGGGGGESGGGSGDGSGGGGGDADTYYDDSPPSPPPATEDGVRTEYECRLRFPNEVYIDRFLLVLAGADRVSGRVIIRDERSNRQISETFVAQQGMNTIRFKERLRSDSVKVIVLMGQREGSRLYTYDAWVVYDLLERMGGARK
jgi:hypothetical protein